MTGSIEPSPTDSPTASDSKGSDLRADVRDAGVLVRTELRARVRHVRSEPRQFLAIAFLAVVFGVGLPLVVFESTFDYGGALAGTPVPVGQTGAVFAAVGGAGLYLGGASGLSQNRLGTVGPLVRASIPPRAVVIGRFAAETLQGTATIVPTALALLAIVAVGAGNPLVPLVFAVVALPVFLAATLAGRVFGDLLRVANRRLGVSLWTKAILFLVVTVAAYVGSQVFVRSRLDGADGFGSFAIPALLPGTPLQAYASAAFDPLGSARQPVGVLTALALLAAVPIGFAVVVRLERRLLLGEFERGAGNETTSRESHGVPRPFTASPSARVAWRHLLRTRRDPRTLAHLGPLLFGALGMAGSVFTDPQSLRVLGPAGAIILGVTLAGAAYCLNPLGDDRDQLPLLLTSTPSTAVLLRGRALAGAIPGLAIALGAGVSAALVVYDPPTAVGLALLSLLLAAAGAGTALGAGALIPKFERREYMSVERAHPSMIAVLGFFFGSVAVGAVGVLLVWYTVHGGNVAPIAVAWTVYVALVGASGGGGYVYAVRKFDAFSLDDA
ncbi:hypothetical protein [Halosimplex sp. TS25]|uniref:hypothetical protein n=1 Tax=Halosimplex rarum TaxID=3396619 RepID=UPI0039E9DC19